MIEYLSTILGSTLMRKIPSARCRIPGRTPLCFVARADGDGEESVRFLLERGAEPYIKDYWRIHDAFVMTEYTKNS